MFNGRVVNTNTGKIYVDCERKLEFLAVGDYGKENNIKANFLGYTKEINSVRHQKVSLANKWVATISTQKGCPMRCKFCDVPKYGYFGNCTEEDLTYQVETLLQNEPYTKTDRFNVHYARMGEPTFNPVVLDFTRYVLKDLVNDYIDVKDIHPVISTMLPKANKNLLKYLLDWCDIKNNDYEGNAGLQFSINSTDDQQRDFQFNGMSHSLAEISDIAKLLPMPVGRKYTLNFAVTRDTILDANRLTELFDKDKFIVKITPIHETKSASENGFDKGDCYNSYNVYRKFEQPLIDKGWDVIVFIPSLEEDADRITCGNALIGDKKEN